MDLAIQIETQRDFGELICQRLRECIDKLGFDEPFSYPVYQTAHFVLVKDPYTGRLNLSGDWHDNRGQRVGKLQFQSDDSCYAEFDIIKNHPVKKQWFVEKVTVWGKRDALVAEPTLLRLPN